VLRAACQAIAHRFTLLLLAPVIGVRGCRLHMPRMAVLTAQLVCCVVRPEGPDGGAAGRQLLMKVYCLGREISADWKMSGCGGGQVIYMTGWEISAEWKMSGCGGGQVIYMTGWAPDASHSAAMRRGSATVKLEDLAELQRQRDRAQAGADTGEGQ